jgi:hypothetical protein
MFMIESQGGSKMDEEKDILTPEEIEEIIRKLEADYPELMNPRQTQTSEKPEQNN